MAQTQTATSSRNSLVATASKLDQLVKCNRSVLDTPQSLERNDSGKSNAAAIGSKLHICLDVLTQKYVATRSEEEAYQAGLDKSKSLDVVLEFLDMSRELIFGAIKNFVGAVRTEHSMAISKSGVARVIDSYKSINEDDVFAGTADVVALDENYILTIIDWKTGLEPVDVHGNWQLISLAWMAISIDKNVDVVRLGIVNPVLATAEYTALTRASIEKKITALQLMTYDMSNIHEFPGPHCKYCPLKSNCKSFATQALTIAQEYYIG